MIITVFLSQWPFQASKHVLLKNNQAIVSSVLSYCTVLATFFLNSSCIIMCYTVGHDYVLFENYDSSIG